MPQANVNPEELLRFTKSLKHFNQTLREHLTSLTTQFQRLSETWNDRLS